MIDSVAVTRYVTPLREGGSLPGLVEGDDLGTYVCKFRGAGQGVRVLVAEVIVSGLALRLGLRTPRLVVLELDPQIARYEADEEVQDLLNASPGLNLGIDFLPGAFGYEGETSTPAEVAARVLWLDAFTANVDRTWRNPNLLLWHDDLWVIDHGASLYFHHGWSEWRRRPVALRPAAVGRARPRLRHPSRPAPGGRRLGGADLRRPDRGGRPRCPNAWLEPVPGAESRRRPPLGLRRVPHRAARGPAPGCPRVSAA